MLKTLIIAFFLLCVLSACKQNHNDNLSKPDRSDSSPIKDMSFLRSVNQLIGGDTLKNRLRKIEKERVNRRKQLEAEWAYDSIMQVKFLNDALTKAYSIKDDVFKLNYLAKDDSARETRVELLSGYFFSRKFPHLIIRRISSGSVSINVFSKTNDCFEPVITHEIWAMTYINDTIRDINGDGLNDFVVNGYGASGCCLKAFSEVFLNRKNGQSFSAKLWFINPSFSPKEGVIRGICYGHPGETEMYKFRWRGEKVDTVEFISCEKKKGGEKTGKILVTDRDPHSRSKILKRVSKVPDEYLKIEGYEWFTGFVH